MSQEFTADVFYELYKAKTDTNNGSPIDVGSLIINYTLRENAQQAGTSQASQSMHAAKFFHLPPQASCRPDTGS